MTMERISFDELPEAFYRNLSEVEKYVNSCGLDPRLLHLIRYRISIINHCAYCLDMHAKEALHDGEESLRLYTVAAWRESPYYSERETLALELAERLTQLPDAHVDDAFFQRLLTQFSKEEIAHLALAIAQINTWNRLVQCFRPEPGKFQLRH